MKDLNSFEKALKVIEKMGLKIEATVKDNSIVIGKINFQVHTQPDRFKPSSKNEGLLLQKTSQALRASLQKKRINYFDLNGNIFFNSDGLQVHIEEDRIKPIAKKNDSPTRLNPTNLISPNGLSFIDVLLRMNDTEIGKFQSALQFCKAFDLYQPKVSQIMSKIGAKGLLDFKKKIKNIPLEWWLFALEFPATKRKMTHFFGESQKYYSLSKEPLQKSDKIFSILEKKYANDVTQGPIEVAKSYGEIIDDSLSIWASPTILNQLKKDFKLIPGSKEGYLQWLIASPPYSIEKEELLSHLPNSKPKTNIMRVIWDLGFGDSRLQEARLNILRKLLNEI